VSVEVTHGQPAEPIPIPTPPGCLFLLDAALIDATILDGGSVTSCPDALPGSALALTNHSGTIPVINRSGSKVLNNNPCLTSAAWNYRTTSGGVTGNQDVTIYAVITSSTASGYKLAAALGAPAGSGNCSFGAAVYSGVSPVAWVAGGNNRVDCYGNEPDSSAPSPGTPTNPYGKLAVSTTTATYVVVRYQASTGKAWVEINGYLLPAIVDSSGVLALVAGLGIFPHASGNEWSGDVYWVAWCAGNHDAATRARIARGVRRRFGTSIASSQSAAQNILCGIDSLTRGTGATPGTDDYVTQLAALLRPCTWWNLGVPSRTVVTAGTTDFDKDLAHATQLAPLNVASVWADTNDLLNNYNTPGYEQTALANLIAYCKAIRAAVPGVKIIVCTLLHSNNPANPTAYNAMVDALNALIRATAGAWDAVADLIADSRLQDPANATYFAADQLHLVAAGYAVVAGIIKALLAARLNRPSLAA
jgi:lysophospholipase L1-like esterase